MRLLKKNILCGIGIIMSTVVVSSSALQPKILDHYYTSYPAGEALWNPANNAESTFTYKNSNPPMTLNVHFPPDWQPTDKRPVIIGSYGSGWKGHRIENGDVWKNYMNRWDKKLIRYAAKYGMVGVVFDYRGSRTSPAVSIEGGISDAKSAIRWVRKNAARLGIDTTRIISGGSSSGGHLAAAAVLFTDKYDDPADDKTIPTSSKLHICMNCIMGDNSRGSGVDPKYAPANFLQKGFPPTILMFGDQDGWRFSAEQFVDSAKKYGVQYEYMLAPGYNHDFDNIIPGYFDTTLHWGVEFMQAYGHLDFQQIVIPNDTADFSSLKKVIEKYCTIVKKGDSKGVVFTAEGGGSINQNGLFLSGALSGIFRIKAQSVAFPDVIRYGYARIAYVIDDPSADQFTTTGTWTQIKTPQGIQMGTKVFSIDRTQNGTLTFKINPPSSGYYAVYLYSAGSGTTNLTTTAIIKDKYGETKSGYYPDRVKNGLYALSNRAKYFEQGGSGTISIVNIPDAKAGIFIDALILAPAFGSRSQPMTSVNDRFISHSLLQRSPIAKTQMFTIQGREIKGNSAFHKMNGVIISKSKSGAKLINYNKLIKN